MTPGAGHDAADQRRSEGLVGPPAALSAIGRGLLILGDQWTLLILQRAFLLRIRRFADWRESLGVSESVLAARLREMTANGLLAQVPYRDEGRTRLEYRLTERALELWALLVAIWSWERRFARGRRGAPRLVHRGCGRATDVELACAACGDAVTAGDTQSCRGEGVTFAGSRPPRLHRRRTSGTPPDDGISWYPETMAVLGDLWSTSVLAAGLLGVRRFTTFQAELGIAPSLLADRLRRFVDAGVMEPPGGRGDYRLTDKGLAFFSVFTLLVEWSQRHLDAPPGSALTITHRPCGAELGAVLRCRACRQLLTRRDVHFTGLPRPENPPS